MKKNIIVTGGLGFIGSNLVNYLIEKKFNVINVDKISYSSNIYNVKEHLNNSKYKFVKCDINNKKNIKKILYKYKPVTIFNLAAETHVDRSIDSPKEFIKSNIIGVYNLLEIFRKYSNKYKKTKLIPMTIDGLLDKIIEEGIDSLTIEEKEFLNKFNK